MIRSIGLAVLLVAGSATQGRAQTAPEHVAKAQELYQKGDFVHAREELLAAYAIAPDADLVFGLGQVEFNLKHYAKAIEYYEQFMATNPDGERAELAEQAIGAARIELRRPPPPPPPPPPLPPHRLWDGFDTSFVIAGGVLGVAGGALLYYAHDLSEDHSGTLESYDTRIHHAHIAHWTAIGCFGGGVAALATAALRWKFHLVDTSLEVHPTTGGATVSLELPL